MTPIVSIVGPAGSGKTTLLEKTILELKRRGRRVAVIKHSACDVELDKEGKDSWRHSQAGAEAVIVSSPSQWAMFKRVQQEWGLEALRNMLPEVDIILTEGYRGQPAPKLEIVPPGAKILSPAGELLALIGEDRLGLAVPCFSRDDAEGIVDFLEERFL